MNRQNEKKSVSVKLIVWSVITFISLVVVTGYIFIAKNAYTKPEVSIELGEQEEFEGVYVDLFREWNVTWMYTAEHRVDRNRLGEYKVVYNIKGIWGQELYQKVKVVDTTPPEIYIEPMENPVFSSIIEALSWPYKATDKINGDVTRLTDVTYKKTGPNQYEITYTAKDPSGNVTVEKNNVMVVTGEVALTFDDGPSWNITPRVLDLLQENGVQATFFVLAFEGKEDLIKREYEEGHTIGFHGYDHTYSNVYSSIDSVMNNFYKIEEMVIKATGESSRVVRFPGGSSNTVSRNYTIGIMTEATKRITEEGYVYFDWNVDSDDAGRARTSGEVYQNVVAGIRPGRLNVVLMHDAAGKNATLGALQDIIDYCIENDYMFVTLSTESTQVTHKIYN